MKQYILKLKTTSTTNYALYDGTTALTDAQLTTLFTTAGSAYFTFDFDSLTPSATNAITIVDSSDTAVVTNTNLTDTIVETKDFKGTWSASATAFDTFVALSGVAMDEAQLSDLMGKIKGALETRSITVSSSTDLYDRTLYPDGFYKITGSGNTAQVYLANVSNGKSIRIAGGKTTYAVLGTGNTTSDRYLIGLNVKSGEAEAPVGMLTALYASSSSSATKLFDGATVDNLTYANYNYQKPLNARQGKVLADRIGTLSNLTTTVKTSTVAAINEVNAKAIGTSETLTIASTDWTALSSSDPYDYSATVTATTTISATSTVELINDQAVLFGTHGFAIGSVDTTNNTLTIYSIGQPSASVSLTIKVRS